MQKSKFKSTTQNSKVDPKDDEHINLEKKARRFDFLVAVLTFEI